MNAVIIGAGASGIACAIRLKQKMPECRVTVLEHLDIPCKKIYATGNGRCNISNINAEGYEITKDFLNSLGLVLRTDSKGRVYPYSNRADSVTAVFSDACKKYGVNIITGCNAYKADKDGSRFEVFTNSGKSTTYYSDILVISAGGKAQESLGSDGSGYKLAKDLGHSVSALSPALVQLKSPNKNCRTLSGTRTKCRETIEINGSPAASSYGEVLFTDYGISGIVTMDLSLFVNEQKIQDGIDRCVSIIDFVPEMSTDELVKHIECFGSLEGILPKKLCSILERQSKGDIEKIALYAKNQRFIISGTKGYSFAQITNGGIPLDEIDSNFESLICPNLYFTGEITDRQFNCGGYNLNFAVLSGIKAAEGIADKNKNN